MEFRATLLSGGRTATGIRVPEDVVEALGRGRRAAVAVTVGEHTWRTTLGVLAGHCMIPVSAENRSAAGVVAGDELLVTVEPDDAPRVLQVPDDLAAALDAEPAARQAFDALSYSGRRRHVLSVDGAKTAATRERRVAKAVEQLRDG